MNKLHNISSIRLPLSPLGWVAFLCKYARPRCVKPTQVTCPLATRIHTCAALA
nr:MAG TPA: hypothetical protein [Caudoviricetes sp.]